MRKAFLFLCLVFIFTLNLYVYAQDNLNYNYNRFVMIKDKNGNMKQDGLEVNATLPMVIIESNPYLQNKINKRIDEVFYLCVQNASNTNSRRADIEYSTFIYEDVYSLIIKAVYYNGYTEEHVHSINFDMSVLDTVDITNICGPNSAYLLTSYLTAEVKNARFQNFPAISGRQSFYVENGNLVLLFDNQKVIEEVSVPLDWFKNMFVDKSLYYQKDGYGIKMLPLRNICEFFNYVVKWNGTIIEVSREGFFSTMNLGENKYFKGRLPARTLEVAPENKDGITYVPISFYSEILGLAYSIDANGNIIFSELTKK